MSGLGRLVGGSFGREHLRGGPGHHQASRRSTRELDAGSGVGLTSVGQSDGVVVEGRDHVELMVSPFILPLLLSNVAHLARHAARQFGAFVKAKDRRRRHAVAARHLDGPFAVEVCGHCDCRTL